MSEGELNNATRVIIIIIIIIKVIKRTTWQKETHQSQSHSLASRNAPGQYTSNEASFFKKREKYGELTALSRMCEEKKASMNEVRESRSKATHLSHRSTY